MNPGTVAVSVKHIVDVLNEILQLDPTAISELGRLSVPCNRKLAEHPTVQVRATAGKHDYRVGILGILKSTQSKMLLLLRQLLVRTQYKKELLCQG